MLQGPNDRVSAKSNPSCDFFFSSAVEPVDDSAVVPAETQIELQEAQTRTAAQLSSLSMVRSILSMVRSILSIAAWSSLTASSNISTRCWSHASCNLLQRAAISHADFLVRFMVCFTFTRFMVHFMAFMDCGRTMRAGRAGFVEYRSRYFYAGC